MLRKVRARTPKSPHFPARKVPIKSQSPPTAFEVGGRLYPGTVNVMVTDKGRVFYDITDLNDSTQGIIAQHGEPRVESLGAGATQANPGAEVKSEGRRAVEGRVRAGKVCLRPLLALLRPLRASTPFPLPAAKRPAFACGPCALACPRSNSR